MPEGRPAIPAELARAVMVEAGHRCAIPTCRYPTVEIHHIVPWALTRTHSFADLIALCPNCHAHAESGKIDRKSLRLYKERLTVLSSHDGSYELPLQMIDLESPLVRGFLTEDGPLVEIVAKPVLAAQTAMRRQGESPSWLNLKALVDTGAAGSLIDKGAVATLGIHPVSVRTVRTLSSTFQAPVYGILIETLDHSFLDNVLVSAVDLPIAAAMLLGRDILAHATFRYYGTAQIFSLRFDSPGTSAID